MGVKERLEQYLEYKKIKKRHFEESIGASNGFINSIKKSISPDFLDKISNEYTDLNILWLILGKGEMLKNKNNGTVEAATIPNPNVILVPLISQYAYAGYLNGFADEEYIDTLPKVPMFANHEVKGEYMAFEVRGDSMEENSKDGIFEGDILYCRQIKRDLWKYKLHINQWDFVIVHKTEGVLIKRIIDHDTDTGNITIHSLNPEYEDKVLNMNDIDRLFNVVEISRARRR